MYAHYFHSVIDRPPAAFDSVSDVAPVPSLNLEMPGAPMSRDDDLMADRISTPSLLRSDPQEEMYVTRPGAVRVPGPLSDQYLDSAVLASTPVSSRVISGKANDRVENLVVTDVMLCWRSRFTY